MQMSWFLLCLLSVLTLPSVPTAFSSTSSYNVLHNRNVFTCGFGDSLTFATNFLQALHMHRHRHIHYRPFANASDADIVVVYGVMSHCLQACKNFSGLIIYLDNEAGRPVTSSYLSNFTQQNLAQMIYLGVPTIDLPQIVIKIPCIFGVQTLHWSSTTVKRVFSRSWHTENSPPKTHFLAYAATKCLPMREMVFDGLVELSKQHNLGMITAYGACHGSPKNVNYSHTTHTLFNRSVLGSSSSSSSSSSTHVSDTSRKHFGNNGVLFQPFKYVLAMENDDVDHYMTEKIFFAYQAGAIPLYWGASSIVHDMFHPDTFIYIDPLNLQAAFSRILEIERNPLLYQQILQTPVLLHGEETIRKYLPVGIPASSAADPRLYNASISNRIWAEIIQHLRPLSSARNEESGSNHTTTMIRPLPSDNTA